MIDRLLRPVRESFSAKIIALVSASVIVSSSVVGIVSMRSTQELPRNAVFNHNQVFVINDNRLKKKIIEIVKVNERTIIFRGIEEGSVVVSEPLINALENSLVEIIK